MKWSSVHEDSTSVRLVHFQQLAGTDVLAVKGRLEIAGFATGINNFREEEQNRDLRILSIGAFVERKLSGNDHSNDARINLTR